MSGILIVDDNPSIRYLLRVFVENKTAFKVCGEAGHGVDAIDKAKELQPDFNLARPVHASPDRCRSGIHHQEDDAAGEDHSFFYARRRRF
jgi:DNA-binding NarL/FixJ family response regulator